MGEGGRDVVDAARAVRAYLPDLVEEHRELDAELVAALRRRASADVDDELVAILGRDQRVLDWVAAYLQYGLPPDLVAHTERGVDPMPGFGGPIDVDRFECPVDGNFVFYRRRVGQPMPPCPDHHGVALVRVP